MKQYYIVIGGQQAGPYSVEELIVLPEYNSEAYVWSEGMTEWVQAGAVPELAGMNNTPVEEQACDNTDNSQPQAASPAEAENECPKPELGLAIFSAIMFPLGIAAIVKTALIKVRWNQGRYDDARWLAKTAHQYAVRSLVIGFVLLGIVLTYYFVLLAFILAI